MSCLRHTGVIVACVAMFTAAHAHTTNYPKRLTAEITPDRVRLAVAYDLDGDEAGQALRDRFDADHDGQIDQDEAELARKFVADDLRRTLYLAFGAQRPVLTLTSVSDRGIEGAVKSRTHTQFEFVFEAVAPSTPAFDVSIGDEVNEGLGVVPVQVSVAGLRLVDGTLRGTGSAAAQLTDLSKPAYLLRGHVLTLKLKQN